ncbi:Membrane protein involved in the export of O-antigen and teichoic acid [Chryseobacterium arachidis]|uniref:Membrane protein involved in the export of O-antigen and teichoic acid n=2 Tax=Chryseobacterium arachidis TaxID=1416778 RepID=A0A1M5E781_9FLAO|nr:polysaccharide biosynthesis C-terminal domain-containing protein [Chryseobacterium arachidis]SHF74932.1 Membrane protein involved in the export of O-antigen and teichoic acid [Chryseobacterium arachidis]
MKQNTILKTFVSRFLILILNFGLVIYSTNMWGSEGKGVISIVIADLTIISFFANIFVGSSVSYFASKFKTEEILPFAYIWSIIMGVLIPVALSFNHASEYSDYLMALSVVSSLLAANVNLFVGRQNIRMFNLYTVLQQLIHIVFIGIIIYIVKITSVNSYFIAQISCFGLLFLISTFQVVKNCDFKNVCLSRKIGYQLFNYGWKTQLSAFLQFLNYRLSFYFLEYFKGIISVGIFSVGVAFSEAIWTVSRSLSVVLYADVVNNKNVNEAIEKTKVSMRVSFLVTALFIVIMLLIPGQVYAAIFGKDFSQTKEIILYLSPGILSIAVSNIIGYYFAGINKLRILNIKSLVGLVFTVISSFYIIPLWGIKGACIVTSISYCLSSAVLFWRFYQITEFSIHDFILSKKEIILLWSKMMIKK